MDVMSAFSQDQLKDKMPDFRAGDNVSVSYKIVEGDKERIQIFKGLVIKKNGNNINSTFTVRKISGGIGVERIFPLHSPKISKIEVLRKGKVRRSKLYYIRKLKGKAAKIEEQKQ
ncbi:MAG: 50S ribosomal protein L19 [bacterium]